MFKLPCKVAFQRYLFKVTCVSYLLKLPFKITSLSDLLKLSLKITFLSNRLKVTSLTPLSSATFLPPPPSLPFRSYKTFYTVSLPRGADGSAHIGCHVAWVFPRPFSEFFTQISSVPSYAPTGAAHKSPSVLLHIFILAPQQQEGADPTV